MLLEPRMGQKCQQRPLLGTWICSAMCQNGETCDNKTTGQILTVFLVLTILARVLTVLALVLTTFTAGTDTGIGGTGTSVDSTGTGTDVVLS